MDQIQELVRLIDRVLGADVIGTYLHGSSVLGGLKPASDVDVLVVSRRGMGQQERRALLGGLLAISGSRNEARPVELTAVVQSEVRPWRYPPIGDFLYGEWLRPDYEAGEVPRPEPMPDLALLITMARAGDHPLTGPRPEQVLDVVPHADLVRANVAGIPDLLNGLEDDTRNVLLTFARIWATLATGQIWSKPQPTGSSPSFHPSTAPPSSTPSTYISAAATPRRPGASHCGTKRVRVRITCLPRSPGFVACRHSQTSGTCVKGGTACGASKRADGLVTDHDVDHR